MCACINYVRTLVGTLVGFEVGQYHSNYASNNRGMISKVIKLKLQCFIHVYVQATCQRDPEASADPERDRGPNPPPW